MNPTDQASIPDSVVARRVGEETVILDLASGTYFGLDRVGARIWQLMADGNTMVKICDALEGEFEADRSRIENDLNVLAGELHTHGLILLQAPSARP